MIPYYIIEGLEDLDTTYVKGSIHDADVDTIEPYVMSPGEKRQWRLMQLQQVQAENRKHIKKPRKGKR